VGVPVIEHVPRSPKVQEAEAEGKTVIEAFPDSDQAKVYHNLAKKVLENKHVYLPDPMAGMDEILQLAREFIHK
jgi:nitrogenase iron protein NifH